MHHILYLVLFSLFSISQTFAIENIAITMHLEERICPLIAKLEQQLKIGNTSSLEEFWEEVELRTTPLTDSIDGNETEILATFLWRAKKDHTNVVVASYGICSFDPFKNQMVNLPGTDVWYKSWILPKNTRTVYCISPDDPLISISDYRLDQLSSRFNQCWTKDPLNPKAYYIPGYLCLGEVDKTMSLLEMPDAPSFPWKNEDEYSRGVVLDANVPSSILEEGREVYIYLPPDYDRNRTIPYPLVVAFDGDIYKDFIEAPAIFDFLIKEGKIPPLIAVMIKNPQPNTVTRFRDLACHEPFMDFVSRELIPWMRKNYCVTENPSQTVIAGGSLGAVISTYMGLVHSDIFGNVIAEVGTYWWPIKGEQDWLIQQYAKSPRQNLRFFLDVGSLETVPTFSNGSSILNSNRHFRDVLRAKGYSVKYVEFAGGHDFICMQHTFAEGLEHLLGQ
jgi:enterochelin esterase-like enzyme